MDSEFPENNEYTQTVADPIVWNIQSALDPDLSDILDQVIDIAPESIAGINCIYEKRKFAIKIREIFQKYFNQILQIMLQ